MAALPFFTGTKANSRGLVPCDVELMKSQVAIWKAAPVSATGRLWVNDSTVVFAPTLKMANGRALT